MERKTERCYIRLSKSNKERIKKMGLKYSDIFNYGLNGITKEDNKELIKQIKMIGNNLNQLAKIANQNKDINILKELKGIRNDIETIKSQITIK